MYTRCPECETVFRLSASALKQAGGKVRCGACDSTFNALQSLAEDFTSSDSAREFAERAVGDGHITPEQGEALLQSLERLEVPDVELEDTGVEWRVLTPPAELTEPETDDLGVDTSGIIVSDAPQDDEGPVEDAADEDEDLDEDEEPDDLNEDEDEDGLDDLDDDEDEDEDDLDDLDDDEDEDLDDLNEDEDEDLEDDEDEDEDLDDLDDDEDEDLDDLDDLDDDDELDEDEDLDDLDDDEDEDEDDEDDEEPDEDEDEDDLDDDEDEDEDEDDELDEDEDEDDLDDLDDLDDDEDEDLDDLDDDEDEDDDEDLDDLDEDEDEDLDDLDDDEELEEDDDEDLDDLDEDDEDDEEPDEDEDEDDLDEDDELDEDEDEDDLDDDEDDEELEEDDDDLDDDDEEPDEDDDLDDDEEPDEDDDDDDEDEDDDDSEDDEPDSKSAQADPEPRYDDNSPLPEGADDFVRVSPVTTRVPEQVPPADIHDPMTAADLDLGDAEEWEDLLGEVEDYIAAEEAAMQPVDEEDAAKTAQQAQEDEDSDKRWSVEDAPMVESIVMEGDSLTNEQMEVSVDELEERVAQLSARAKTPKPAKWRSLGLSILVIFTALTLSGQVIHSQRETLATLPYFPQTLGKIYRFFDYPVVPDWNVRGWQFEVTEGSTDASDQVLTIASSLSNQATTGLPYPLIQVALTDRFDKIIDTRVVGPREYLDNPANLSGGVGAGQQFVAAFDIPAVGNEATGFKLNICYPAANGQMRCASGDFLH